MSNTEKTMVILWIAISFILSASGQTNYIFRNINIQHGLPDNQIKGLFLSPDGRIGIRTAALLAFDNGGSFSSHSYHIHQAKYDWNYDNIHQEYVDSHNYIWMKERNYLRIFDLTQERFINNIDSLLQKMGITEELQDLFIDSEKRYWFILNKGKICCIDNNRKNLQYVDNNGIFIEKYGEICDIDGRGDSCWIVHKSGIVRCWNSQTNKFIRQEEQFANQFRSGERVMLKVLPNGDFWLKWQDGVACYNIRKQQWHEIKGLNIKQTDLLTSLAIDNEGNAWIGSSKSGLYIIDKFSYEVEHIHYLPLVGEGYIDNDILDIIINPQNNSVWLGLLNQGICYYHPSLGKFSLINNTNVKGKWEDQNVRSMVEYDNGNILLGTNSGLYCYNPKTSEINLLFTELADKICRKMLRDSKGRIWIGTFHHGLYCIENGRLFKCNLKIKHQKSTSTRLIRCLFEDSKGNIWIGIYGGLCSFNPINHNMEFVSDKHIKIKKFTSPSVVIEDKEGRLIVGDDNGLYYYYPDKEKVWVPEIDAPHDERFHHTNNKYNCIYCDSRGMTWFGTHNGLNILEVENNTLRKMKAHSYGISNNIIMCIFEDQNHDIWLSTTNGLNKIVVKKEKGEYHYSINSFNSNDGLMKGEYYPSSGFKAWDGTLYFGGINGFSTFLPENIIYNYCDNYPFFTSLKIFYANITPSTTYNGRQLLNHNLNNTPSIELQHDENYITLEFAGLNYVNPSKTYYKYKLEGIDTQWQEVKSSDGIGKVTYSGLGPGKYVFQVYTANSDHFWGKQNSKLTFIIKEPYWNTIAARLCYVLIIISISTYVIYHINKKNKLKLLKTCQLEQQKQKEELDQMKFRFFTNISHEFRTPLTLIITPLSVIINESENENLKGKLMSIYNNAQKLLALVNQLLDFRKLEVKGEKINLGYGEISDFIYQCCTSFQPIMTEKSISFKIDLPKYPIYMYFDQDKIYKVMNNLLSNAYKFTPEYGEISIQLSEGEENFLFIKISDTGIGISEENLPHIFDRFYQISSKQCENTGSGIGLHLAKEYINLLHGKIEVTSIANRGTTFTICLPTNLHPQEKMAAKEDVQENNENDSSSISPNKPIILLVEDNTEFRNFLKEELNKWYQVIEAKEGLEGEKIAIERDPNLIISDVMMPIMNGIELCKRLKNNIQTSHIPIILLTARISDEDKMTGYEAGADSYLSKPFNFDILLTRIRKLIEQQENRKATFHRSIEVSPSSITITSLDEKLVQKALHCVEENMENPEYSVEKLAADIGMTRMSLYRKLQSITGQTPTEFIRSIRLKRAAQLLQNYQLSIVEITDMVGFNTPRYFTKCFKETFGILPSEYSNAHRKK